MESRTSRRRIPSFVAASTQKLLNDPAADAPPAESRGHRHIGDVSVPNHVPEPAIADQLPEVHHGQQEIGVSWVISSGTSPRPGCRMRTLPALKPRADRLPASGRMKIHQEDCRSDDLQPLEWRSASITSIHSVLHGRLANPPWQPLRSGAPISSLRSRTIFSRALTFW